MGNHANRKIRRNLSALAAVALAANLSGARAHAAPVESYGRLPDLEDVRLSPDGQHIAFVGANDQNERIVIVVAVGGKGEPVILKSGAVKLRALEWADNTHLIIVNSETSPPPFGFTGNTVDRLHASVYDLTKRWLTVLQPPADAGGFNTVLGIPAIRRVDGHTKILFKAITFSEHRSVPTLYAMDLATGGVRFLDQGSLTERDYVVGVDGREMAQSFYGEDGRWTVKVRTPEGWRSQVLDGQVDVPFFEGLGPAGDTVVIGNVDRGHEHDGLKQISLKDGAWLEAELPGRNLIRDQQTGLTIGMRSLGERATFQFFDPALQKSWTAILKAFPGEQVDYVSISDDRTRFVVHVFGQTTGDAFMMVDLKTGAAELIGDVYRGVQPADIAETHAISYAAADGLNIPAYLTLPRGRDAKGLPLVVVPHGGPGGRDLLDFSWWAQALASRGYAVLQPEYRGSDGYTEDFRAKGFGEWGGKMLTDLSDGVRALATQGTIDPKRVCILGENYGGYAALDGVAQEPGVYRCAVSVAGLSDMPRMMNWIEDRARGHKAPALAYYDRYVGAAKPNDPKLAAISPARSAARISAPVLLIHGKDDTVIPIEQSQVMANALKAAGKSVQLIAINGEDHWLSRSESRLQTLQATVQFLEANNPPDAPKTAVAAQ